MEAPLLDFVLDVAQVFFADISQDFAEHPFECVVLDGSSLRLTWWGDCGIAVVTDIESGAEAMAALVGSISIALLEASNIVFCPKYTRDDDLVKRYTFYI